MTTTQMKNILQSPLGRSDVVYMCLFSCHRCSDFLESYYLDDFASELGSANRMNAIVCQQLNMFLTPHF